MSSSPENSPVIQPIELRPELYKNGVLDPDYAKAFDAEYDKGQKTAWQIHTELGGIATDSNVAIQIEFEETLPLPARKPAASKPKKRLTARERVRL